MQKTSYEFDNFRLDPIKQQLFRDGMLVPLPLRVFDLLLVFVQNPGRELGREELIERVWKRAFVSEGNFDVALHKVRNALAEPKRAPRYILKTSDGYRFVGEVREVVEEEKSGEDLVTESPITHEELEIDSERKRELIAFVPRKQTAQIFVSGTLYAALYAAAVPLEVAYRFDQFGPIALKVAPLVFVGMLITSVVALVLDRAFIFKNKASGFLVSILVFVISAGLLLAVLSFFLPSYPITESSLQTYPAQAAYLKDESYFIILAIFFLIIPFHFVATMEREITNGNHAAVNGLLTGNKSIAAPKGSIYARFWALAGLLLVFLILSVAMTARLLDNLKPSPYQNLFVQLVYLRGLLFFGLGVECLIWYYRALEEIKRRSSTLHTQNSFGVPSPNS